MRIILLTVFLAFCGRIEARQRRMAGGTTAHIDQFPFYAILSVNGLRVCSGALISTKHVLTAAHCVVHKQKKFFQYLVVRTGTDDLHQGGTSHKIEKIITHENFQKEPKVQHDIAVIHLTKDVKQTLEQKPIKLATSQVVIGERALVAGFGYILRQNRWVNDVFQYHVAPVLSPDQCRQKLTTDRIDEHSICLITQDQVRIEKGDSGGVLIQNDKVVGVISWSNPLSASHPVIFMNVYDHMDFIKRAMSKDVDNKENTQKPDISTEEISRERGHGLLCKRRPGTYSRAKSYSPPKDAGKRPNGIDHLPLRHSN